MKPARAHLALASVLFLACDGGVLRAFEPRTLGIGGSNEPSSGGETAGRGGAGGGTAGGTAGASAGAAGLGGTMNVDSMAGAGGGEPSSSLLIDDFKDGDTRAIEPLGWWYPINDKTAFQDFGIQAATIGATSRYALHTSGNGFQQWGAAIGLDLTAMGMPLNATAYANLCFTARIESGATPSIQVHLLRGGDHYAKSLSLSESWTRSCVAFADLMGADSAPLPTDQLNALQFFFPPQSRFDFWLVSVELTE
jgi:hypothetical protein